MKDNAIALGLFIPAVVLIIAMWVGWVMNIAELYNESAEMSTGQIVIRGVGIPIVPIGGVMGYIDG